tara:strand:- start:15 stop:215 length:201 start_codon:yes stop_codon:yes gene_type:complete
MLTSNEREDRLILKAGASGGEYLQQINKYNLSELTPQEYTNFVRAVIAKWFEIKAAEEKLDDEIPF